LDVQEQQLLAGMRPGEPGWGVDREPGHFYDGASGAKTERAVPPGDYRQYYIALRDAVLGLGPSPVTPAHAVAVMATLEAARVSAQSGRAMMLPLTDTERGAFG